MRSFSKVTYLTALCILICTKSSSFPDEEMDRRLDAMLRQISEHRIQAEELKASLSSSVSPVQITSGHISPPIVDDSGSEKSTISVDSAERPHTATIMNTLGRMFRTIPLESTVQTDGYDSPTDDELDRVRWAPAKDLVKAKRETNSEWFSTFMKVQVFGGLEKPKAQWDQECLVFIRESKPDLNDAYFGKFASDCFNLGDLYRLLKDSTMFDPIENKTFFGFVKSLWISVIINGELYTKSQAEIPSNAAALLERIEKHDVILLQHHVFSKVVVAPVKLALKKLATPKTKFFGLF